MRVFLILLFSFSLSGCLSLSASKQIAYTANNLTVQYSIVNSIIASKFDSFSEENQLEILELQDHIELLIDQLNNYNSRTTNFRMLYANTIFAYASVKRIISNNSELFSKLETQILIQFDLGVEKLNSQFDNPELYNSVEIVSTIEEIINLSLVLVSNI